VIYELILINTGLKEFCLYFLFRYVALSKISYISKWQQNKKKVLKKVFFLMAGPLPPSPLFFNGPALKKPTKKVLL